MSKTRRTSASPVLFVILLLSNVVAFTNAFLPQEQLDVLKNVMNGVGQGGGGCKFKCSGGGTPVADPSYTPQANGCGTSFMKITTDHVDILTPCCDWHDKCFGTCNKDFEFCENGFKRCMAKKCLALESTTRQTQCQGEADMYSSATAVFGCSFYTDSQKEACTCDGKRAIAGDDKNNVGKIGIDLNLHLEL